jgi:hypothetical protein
VGDVAIVFKIGHTHVRVVSADQGLIRQFRRIYGDCEVTPSASTADGVRVMVRPRPSGVAVDFDTGADVDLAEFLTESFPDRGCRRAGTTNRGVRLTVDRPETSFVVSGAHVEFPPEAPWRALTANIALGLALRSQAGVCFLHAGAVTFTPAGRGVVFVGSKGSGKTTTTLGLAARGHHFLGDELVGIDLSTRTILSVPRTIAKRDGPCAEEVAAVVNRAPRDRRGYASGEERTMLRPSAVFDAPTTGAPFGGLVFLEGFGSVAQLTELPMSWQTASRLMPVATSMAGTPPALRVMRLLRMLSSVAAWSLISGPPDATLDLLESAFSS